MGEKLSEHDTEHPISNIAQLAFVVSSARESGSLTAMAQERGLSNPTIAKTPRWRLLLDPYAALSTRTGLAVIGLCFAVQLLLTRGGVVFDGAIDVYTGAARAGWGRAMAQLALAMALPTLVYTVLVWLLSARPRLLDMAIAVAVARLPLTLLAAASLGVKAATLLQSPWQLAALALLALSTLAWVLVLLFQGVRWASGLAGARLWAAYLLGLVMAEALTWSAIHSLLK